MTVWRLDTGLKRFRKAQSRWWKQRGEVQLGNDITKESEEMQIRGVEKRGLRGAKGNVWRISFSAVIVDETTLSAL